MAATAPESAPASTAQGGIPGFTKISSVVYLHRPEARKSSASSSSPARSPSLIVLAGWMGAREPHLAKYTTRLQALYPRSPIVVLRSFVHHFTTSISSHPAEVAAAVPVIRSVLAEHRGQEGDGEEQGKEPTMLVHLFSNGGCASLRHLREQYAASSPGGLPPHVTIYDSAPGKFHWRRSVTAFMASAARMSILVRLALRVFLNCLFALYWVTHVPWGRKGYVDHTWLAQNDTKANAAEVRRAYIYSEEDALVDYRDIEEHAAAAVQNGFTVAALEKFKGSAHVAHVRVDEARYWGVVKDTWENRARR
ncbi:hypothetical protein KVR01_005893 [Diaporthe batatas]|uniref:uncharacterized protein n=1 Tax=Diaporthe batatas TaxID=748121 RepID=UPI001D039F05|nr:uncharacterized protein KVR01_005893 [Diaporthe batatas]KAG8163975.1 hypothetical protein KVR01_005893 [Diaporthe batatas]